MKSFPLNKGLSQLKETIGEKSSFYECALLASKIIGIECSDTRLSGDINEGDKNRYYLIEILPDCAKTTQDKIRFASFDFYYRENFGQRNGHCYFKDEYESFFNIIKAWTIWNHSLTDNQKSKYIEFASSIYRDR